MGFMQIAEPPPENAEYIDAYNELIEQCRKRGFGDDLTSKTSGDSLTAADMDVLRGAIIGALDMFFDPNQMKLSEDDPFTPPVINGDKGFLVVPGRFTSNGEDVYSTGASFGSSVPVLWDHFLDLAAVLESLSNRKFDYEANIEIDRAKLKITMKFNRGSKSGNPTPSLQYDEEERRIHDSQEIKYRAIDLAEGAEEVSYGIYYRSESHNWSSVSEPIEDVMTFFTDITKNGRIDNLLESESAEGAAWKGNCRIQPVIHFVHPISIAPANGFLEEDLEANGVIGSMGICAACCDARANKYDYIQQQMQAAFGPFQVALAYSPADESTMRVGHFMSTYTYHGIKYGQYNCDTCIEKSYDGSSGSSTWHFCSLRRPSGILVLFSFEGTPWKSSSCNYSMRRNGSTYRLDCTDGVTHVFSGGGLEKCELRNQGGVSITPPGKIKRSGSGSTYRFESEMGIVELTINSHGVPVQVNPRMETTRNSRTAETPEYDIIAEIRTSEELSAATGFDFSAFYPAGEAPDFGTAEKCFVTDFLNASNTMIGKCVDMTFDTGIMVKGFWNREEGVLQPTELSVFERTATESEEADGVFLETWTHIRYGASNRSQMITRTRKQTIGNNEVTIAEYRNYGTDRQQEAIYEYGTDRNSGSYGKLTFSKDFNGGWRKCEYDSFGRLTKEVTPFMDSSSDDPEYRHRVTTYSYALLAENEQTYENDSRPRTEVTTELGQETERNYHLYFEGETWNIRASEPFAPYTAAGNQVTKHFVYLEGDFAGRFWKSVNHDGSSSLTTYEKINLITDEDGEEVFDLQTTTESGFLPDHGTRTVTVTDPAGHVISRKSYDIASGLQVSGSTYTYDRFGRVLTETTVDGDVTATEYNCCGPRYVTDPAGTVTEYGYDVFKRQVFESKAGVTTFHTWDASGREIETTVLGKDGGELTATAEYDADGELIMETAPDGAETHYSRGTGYEQTIDALGGISRTDFYRDGQLKSISGSAVIPKNVEYGVNNYRRYTKEAVSQNEWSRSETDFLGRQVRIVWSDGYEKNTYFDTFGRISRTQDSQGEKVVYEYDSSSGEMKRQAIKRNDSDGIDLAVDLVTEYENGYELYDDTVVQVQKIFQYVNGVKKLQSINRRSRDGKKTWVTVSGRTTRTIRANGENDGEEIETVVNYDGTTRVSCYDEGLRISETDSVFGEISYFHDQFNREIGSDRESEGVTTSERSVLDDAGREISVTRTAGGKSLTTAFTYDALGRKLTETTPEGIVTNWSYTSRGEVETVSGGVYTQHYTYDSQGRILTLTTYQNEDTPEITTYAYDSRGRMTRRTYPDNRSEQYTYRGDGKLSTYTNVRGIEQRYSYNQAGEQTGFSSGNDISRSFSYDQSGNILSVTDANGSYTFTRDEFGNVLTETAGSHTLTRSYDEYRRLIGLTLDGAALYTLSYGTDGRIEKVICGGAAVVYSYRSGTGQIASRNWQIGEDAPFLTFNDNYDALDRLSGVSVDDVPEISYTLDDDSRRITAELVDDSIWTYGYDDKSQLLTATRKSGESGLNAMTYAYDEIGNRTTASEDSAVVNYTANLLNQYTAVNEDTPAYDADGNMLTNAGWSYTWNSENRLVKAEKGTAKLEFAYDYQGRRMFKKVYDGDTLVKHEKYLYNGYKLIAVYDGMNSDALLKTFVWQPVGLDVPLCMTAGSAVYYYLTDGNKNVTGLFDGTGTRAATYMYDPFGQTLSANGTAAESNSFRFSSEFFDTETELIYYNYRYYDPKIGRWVKRDPIGNSGGMNLYAFVHNNGIQLFDKLGQEIRGCCGPDITAPLNKVLEKLERFWNNLSDEERLKGVLFLDRDKKDPNTGEPVYKNGWDIIDLAKWYWEEQMSANKAVWQSTGKYTGCAQGKGCADTVAVGTDCYYSGSVNYILFGKILQLLGFPVLALEIGINNYKGPASGKEAQNYKQSLEWAKYGYGSRKSKPEAEESRRHCNSCGKVCGDDIDFKFYWYPYTPAKGL